MKKSAVVLSCGEGPLLSAGSKGTTRKVEAGGKDCAFVTGEFETGSMPDCADIVFSGISAQYLKLMGWQSRMSP